MFVYDVTNEETFEMMENRIREVGEVTPYS